MNPLDYICLKEGFRATVYRCTEGYPTIGYGWVLGPIGASLEPFKYMVISEAAAKAQCASVVDEIIKKLSGVIASWYILTPTRQTMLISMAYQLGVEGLLQFKRMLKAIENADFDTAALEGLDSRWAKQTPARAREQMEYLRVGFT